MNIGYGLDGDRSDCCYAPAKTDCADEGTCCFVCQKCGKPCGILAESEKAEIEKTARTAIQELLNKKVTAVIIHKPTNTSAQERLPVTAVRGWAEQAVKTFRGDIEPSDFVVVIFGDDGVADVSRL